jgi:hypothetical protein
MGERPVVAVVAAAVAAVILLGVAAQSSFAEGSAAFQLALFAPIQLRDESLSIRALRLNLIYGRNVSVQGLDVGLVNHCTGGASLGLQYGLVGYNEGDFAGWQNNAVNVIKGHLTGLQSSIYNQAGQCEGVQYGLVNVASGASGLQLGLVNYARTMHGLQIGLVNVIRQKEDLPVLPLINWSF